jgi:hypothetical protein
VLEEPLSSRAGKEEILFPLFNHPRGGTEGYVGSKFIVVAVTVCFLNTGSQADYSQVRREEGS